MLPRHPSGGDENWVLRISFENRSPLFGLRSIGGLVASLFEARICVIGGLEERFPLAMRLGVQPRYLVDRIREETIWVWCPGFADEFVGRETTEGLQPACEVVSYYEVGNSQRPCSTYHPGAELH